MNLSEFRNNIWGEYIEWFRVICHSKRLISDSPIVERPMAFEIPVEECNIFQMNIHKGAQMDIPAMVKFLCYDALHIHVDVKNFSMKNRNFTLVIFKDELQELEENFSFREKNLSLFDEYRFY